MAQHAVQLPPKDQLTPAERQLVESFRDRVRKLDLPKKSDAELAMSRHLRANAEVSSAIEGLPLLPVERAFFDMLEEERVGLVGDQLVTDFATAVWRAEKQKQS